MTKYLSLPALVSLALAAAPAAADPFPPKGEARLAAYMVCRTSVAIDMGPVGSQSAAECNGIVKSTAGASPLDNLAMRCLEVEHARKEGYGFEGTCTLTDGGGDRLFLSYTGPESGAVAIFGGSGKYDGLKGDGEWSVADAPGNTPALFAFTLSFLARWQGTAK